MSHRDVRLCNTKVQNLCNFMSPPLLNLSLSVNQSVNDAFMGIRIKYELPGILGMPSEQPSANSEI